MQSLPRLLFVLTLVLFGAIGVAYVTKKTPSAKEPMLAVTDSVSFDLTLGKDVEEDVLAAAMEDTASIDAIDSMELPEADNMAMLFNVADPKLPIVETVTYKSRVSWLDGRPAWVADYARQYKTSRHFIARSLNGKTDYWNQNVSNGDRFNVISADKDVRFHLLVDVSRSRAWFYALDMGDQKRYLLKTYNVGLGRPNPSNPSGCLTPLGTYELGDRIAIYKPKATGWFNGEKVEMIKVFGSRWIPFEKEIANCSAPAKGFGIHGAPWEEDSATGELREERACIGKFESDGCIRFVTEDIEEIFAIVITRPTTIDIVKRFEDAVLPGEEVAL